LSFIDRRRNYYKSEYSFMYSKANIGYMSKQVSPHFFILSEKIDRINGSQLMKSVCGF